MSRKIIELRDITINNQRYVEVLNVLFDSDGNIPNCAGRQCEFFRRGDCWIKDNLGDEYRCYSGRYWRRVNSEGYVLDRDGLNLLGIRIDSNRNLIDEYGNLLGWEF